MSFFVSFQISSIISKFVTPSTQTSFIRQFCMNWLYIFLNVQCEHLSVTSFKIPVTPGLPDISYDFASSGRNSKLMRSLFDASIFPSTNSNLKGTLSIPSLYILTSPIEYISPPRTLIFESLFLDLR